ncbi:lipocalin family protein [Massilia sp. YIM B02763]|uniref:lipocalin family protein n=1 Tax=Massilia sp. YIM B02763 TaxID=3050130 RepID=UPI0025B64375|nr:lipocalin family protein [Massilia sp. YIM B02763]MDN4054759.1 lipocalin family protein [Massilia sp. YIM B02763]
MKYLTPLLLSALLGACAVAQAEPAAAPRVVPIPRLDVPRYMGTWYEIAKYPNRFQKDCAGFTTATYTLQPDKTVQVANRCRRAGGTPDQAIGSARQIGGPASATLKVRFAPRWLSFLPMVWGDYWVIDLDPAYSLVAVSEPTREYLWILSRTPAVPHDAYEALLERLQRQGFDLSKLEKTRQ